MDLPDDLYEIERSTWNTIRIDALRSRFLEENDGRYELNKGEVRGYTQDKDGLRNLRKWPVPSAAYVPYSFDTFENRGFDHTQTWETDYFVEVSGVAQFTSHADAPYAESTDTGPLGHNYLWEVTNGYWPAQSGYEWGVIVQIEDIDAAAPIGEWGEFVQVAGEHGIDDPWGVIVGVFKETNNVRIEYRRRGKALSSVEDFEIPDRYTTYVRHFAQARCLEREGDGQDIELAAHYMARYQAGAGRMLRRKQAMAFQRKYVLGGAAGHERSKKPLARLPWAFGRVVR